MFLKYPNNITENNLMFLKKKHSSLIFFQLYIIFRTEESLQDEILFPKKMPGYVIRLSTTESKNKLNLHTIICKYSVTVLYNFIYFFR